MRGTAQGRWLALAAMGVAILAFLVRDPRRESTLATPESAASVPPPPLATLVPIFDESGAPTAPVAADRRAVASPAARETPIRAGAIVGHVRTDDGFALPDVTVLATEQRERDAEANAVTRALGEFSFSGLRASVTYRVTVDPRTLPEGLLAPPGQGRCVDPGDPSEREYDTCVQLPDDGGDAVAELTVWRAARVEGRLLGAHGEPVPDTPIELAGPGRNARGRTDLEGRFVLAAVFPGEQTFHAYPAPTSEWYDLPRPRLRFVVLPAESVALPDLCFVPGPASIVGRVIDQDGAPVRKLAVLCSPDPGGWPDALLIVGTDADGAFRLDRLPAEHVTVHVGLTGYTGYEDLLVTHEGPSFQLDLRRTQSADLGTIRVERDRPFVLRGRIETNPVDRTSTRFELAASVAGGPLESIRLEPKTLAFEYRTLRSEEPFTLVMTVRRGKYRFPVQPVPDGESEIVLPFNVPH